MDFEWDEDKRIVNISEHGVDFTLAALIFEGPVLTKIDDREDYGEERLVSLGMADLNVFVVVHTRRGERTRIISAWKGGRHEQKAYYAHVFGGPPGGARARRGRGR